MVFSLAPIVADVKTDRFGRKTACQIFPEATWVEDPENSFKAGSVGFEEAPTFARHGRIREQVSNKCSLGVREQPGELSD